MHWPTGQADKLGRKDKSERKGKSERKIWEQSLVRAFLNQFQGIFSYKMKDRHNFYIHTKFFY